jgi:NADH-quinone oxidoreductase subunit I
MKGIFGGFVQTVRSFFTRPITRLYPYERPPLEPRYMGAPSLLWDDKIDEIVCVACNICARSCPDDCIYLTGEKYNGSKTTKKNIVKDYFIDLGRCSYRGICVEVCPFDANEMSPHFELSTYDRQQLVYDKDQLVKIARGVQRRMGKPEPQDVPVLGAIDPSQWR